MGLINFSGIASGIDTEGLIKATADATRAARVTPLEDKVTELTGTNDSLTELKTRLDKLKTAISDFSSLNGGGLVKSATSSDESVVGASAANSAFNGTYEVTVQQKAKNAVATFSDAFSDTNQVIDADLTAATYPDPLERTINIRVGQGTNLKTISIVVDETTTFGSIISTFNGDGAMSTAAVMSAVNVGTTSSPSYRLVISSLNEGLAKGEIDVTYPATPGGYFDSAFATEGKLAAPTGTALQQAEDSLFDITGIATGISRSTNTITDVIPGVTLNLQKESVTPATISVQNDVASSRAKIEDFVEAWNDIVTFLNEQNLVQRQEDGKNVSNTFAPLSKVRVDEGSLSAIRSVLASTRLSLGLNDDGLEESLVMASLGLKTNQNGTLTFNPKTVQNIPAFDQLVVEQPEAVNTLLKSFADTLTRTSGTIDQYTGFGRLVDQTINSNKRQITDYNARILDAETSIEASSSALRQRYARLESQIGRLQSQQAQLQSVLG